MCIRDRFGGTQISFSDVLGGKQVNFFAASVSQYRTLSLSYINIESRLQYALQAFSQDTFFYGQLDGYLYQLGLTPFIDRDLAQAVRTQRGMTGFGIYPFNRYSRVELSGGYVYLQERYEDPALQQLSQEYQEQQFGTQLFQSGHMIPLGLTFVHETTVFRDYGPVAGKTASIGVSWSPKFSKSLSRRTVDVDARYYKRLGVNGTLAFRARGLQSWGDNPEFLPFGGNSEMRGYEYLEFLGHKAFFGNVELRIPLIEAMLTPLGVLGGVRGTLFFNVGGAGINGQSFSPWTSNDELVTPLLGADGEVYAVSQGPVAISGFSAEGDASKITQPALRRWRRRAGEASRPKASSWCLSMPRAMASQAAKQNRKADMASGSCGDFRGRVGHGVRCRCGGLGRCATALAGRCQMGRPSWPGVSSGP